MSFLLGIWKLGGRAKERATPTVMGLEVQGQQGWRVEETEEIVHTPLLTGSGQGQVEKDTIVPS